MIPYGRQFVDEEDIKAVVEVLRSDWLTTGPKVLEFEKAFAEFVGTKEAVAVSSGTAALHAAMFAVGIEANDEVIVPPITFAATANCVVFQGGVPVFSDVEAETLLIDPHKVAEKITSCSKAIVAVDYAGQPCDYDELREIAKHHNTVLVADGCHALGAEYKGKRVGSLADLTIFSFHPVKHITTGEGGMVTTDDQELAHRVRIFRNHGITSDHTLREAQGTWFYEMVDLGYNYRLTDIQCALGISQLRKLPRWLERRREIARYYDSAFAEIPNVELLTTKKDVVNAYHLYVIRLRKDQSKMDREAVFGGLRAEGVGVNVHYIPVHLHPFYKKRFGTGPGLCPVAEEAYEHLISVPIFPGMEDEDMHDVIKAVKKVLSTSNS